MLTELLAQLEENDASTSALQQKIDVVPDTDPLGSEEVSSPQVTLSDSLDLEGVAEISSSSCSQADQGSLPIQAVYPSDA